MRIFFEKSWRQAGSILRFWRHALGVSLYKHSLSGGTCVSGDICGRFGGVVGM